MENPKDLKNPEGAEERRAARRARQRRIAERNRPKPPLDDSTTLAALLRRLRHPRGIWSSGSPGAKRMADVIERRAANWK